MKNTRLSLAIFAIAIIWGTSFLGIRLAVETIPGLYVAGIRHLLASVILLIYLFISQNIKWIGWNNLKIQVIISTCILIVTNGFTTMAQEYISSSLAALISSSTPLLIFVGSVIFKMQSFTLKSLLGILLGFSGIVFIFWDGLADFANPAYRLGILYLFLAVLGFSVGAIYIKKTNYVNDNILLNLFYQFSFAAIIQMATGFILNEEFNISKWSSTSIIALLFLTIFASIIALLAYTYALSQISAVKVSLISYVNTIIAIFLGWLVLDEPVNFNFIIATALIITGIFITNYQPKPFKRKN